MTDKEILFIAAHLGWNMEHETTNLKLVEFARAIIAAHGQLTEEQGPAADQLPAPI